MSDTTYKMFDAEISARESQLAPGSETSIYGDFVRRMAELGGGSWRESDALVPADELAWWRRCYDLYTADQALPRDEQAQDVQDIYDRV